LQTALTLCCASSSAFAQGLVNFANASTVTGWVDPGIDRYVRWENGFYLLPPGSPVSSNSAGINLSSLRAALYYAASTDYNLFDFVAASGGSATLKNSTSATAGSWFGHTDTLDVIPPGVTANLVVFVWDTSVNADPRSACIQGGLFGSSAVFQYTPPTSPSAQPSEFLMNGLTGILFGGLDCSVPEPSSLALLALGAGTVLFAGRLVRRSKC
jgi:hypothetical protein